MDNRNITPPTPDTTQEVRGNEHGSKGPRFGNEYDSHDRRSPDKVGVSIEPLARTSAPDEAIPPESGTRGWIDQKTGTVHGSGSGAGGGQPGEDFDRDVAGGADGPEQ